MTPLAAEEELQVPGCYPYGVRARGSERSRHMRGGFVLWSIEKVAMLGLRLWWSDARCWAGNRRPDTGARCSGQGESPGDVWALLSIRTPHCDERLGTS